MPRDEDTSFLEFGAMKAAIIIGTHGGTLESRLNSSDLRKKILDIHAPGSKAQSFEL